MLAKVETSFISYSVTGAQATCSQCHLREHCLPAGLRAAETSRFDNVITARLRIKRGQQLYRNGEAFTAIYAVKSGFFKTDVLSEDGHDHVTGFQMAGEILGMDGIGSEAHACNAVALEDSEVCQIPFVELERLSCEVRALQRQFHKALSSEIVRDHGMITLLGTLRAGEGLAAFLLNLSQRLTVRGFSPTEFHLRMSREEIGSYLGLRLETVSRLFSRFQEEGLISVEQRHIRILDISGLKNLMAHSPARSPCSVSPTLHKTPRLQNAARGLRQAASC